MLRFPFSLKLNVLLPIQYNKNPFRPGLRYASTDHIARTHLLKKAGTAMGRGGL